MRGLKHLPDHTTMTCVLFQSAVVDEVILRRIYLVFLHYHPKPQKLSHESINSIYILEQTLRNGIILFSSFQHQTTYIIVIIITTSTPPSLSLSLLVSPSSSFCLDTVGGYITAAVLMCTGITLRTSARFPPHHFPFSAQSRLSGGGSISLIAAHAPFSCPQKGAFRKKIYLRIFGSMEWISSEVFVISSRARPLAMLDCHYLFTSSSWGGIVFVGQQHWKILW